MAVPAAIVIVPVGILFILSGLLVNLIQAIFFVIVRPFSKNAYRRINKVVAELLWFELIWLFDWWAGVKIELYTDANTFQLMGKEHALLMPNHRSDIDWLVGWVLAQRSGCLGSSLAIMKRSAQFLPIIGWSMWFSDYVFLERNWVKDENTLKSGYKTLEDYPQPFWLGLFVEGTRFTEAKLLAGQRYAASSGLPIPRNVLIPRTKGFISAVKNMRGFVPAIYDITVALPKSQPQPTLLRLFRGQSSVVKIHIKRHSMQELPETATGISQWCKDMFIAKDAFLEKYYVTGKLNDDEYHDIGRPMIPLIAVIIWFSLLLLLVFELFQWSSLPTWETVAFVVAFLSLVTIVMQILILFTQSERSNPGKTIVRDPEQQAFLQK